MKMAVENISWLIFTKVWDWEEKELVIPGSAVRYVSAVRHIRDCVKWPSFLFVCLI